METGRDESIPAEDTASEMRKRPSRPMRLCRLSGVSVTSCSKSTGGIGRRLDLRGKRDNGDTRSTAWKALERRAAAQRAVDIIPSGLIDDMEQCLKALREFRCVSPDSGATRV